jgi:D-alanyl-D-alanine carboxypeptidase
MTRHQNLFRPKTAVFKLVPVFVLIVTVIAIVRADDLDDYIKSEMHRKRIPGLSMAIVRSGKLVRAKGYGSANIELSTPATENTVYQIGSITKQFTATMIMMLAEEGKISLQDKIADRLPNLPTVWGAVTVRHLLTHTSGIKDYTDVKDFDQKRRLDSTPAEVLDLVIKEPLQFEPGEQWQYCNTNYLLLRLLIERVTRKEYDHFLTERISQPLGMTHTRVNDLRAVIPNRAQGYVRVPRNIQNAQYFSPRNAFGAGDLISTVGDLAKWDAALYTERLLTESSLEQMWTPIALGKGGTAEYGFGWDVKSENGHRLLSHGGNITGFSSAILRFVNDKLTVIVLTNFGGINAETIAQGIAGQVQPELGKKEELPIADLDSKTTERLKRAFIGMMNGDMDHDLFSEKLNGELGPRIRQGKEQAKEFVSEIGPLEKFELLERKATNQGLQLRYRAIFEYQKMMVHITLDKAQKITNWGVQGAP